MGFWARFLRDRLAVAGLAIVLGLVVLSLVTPLIAPYDPSAIDVDNILASPSSMHLFGTDELGRDVFTRMLYGTGISLKVGFVAVGIATLIGVLLGSVSGYFGSWVDRHPAHQGCNIMLCFPILLPDPVRPRLQERRSTTIMGRHRADSGGWASPGSSAPEFPEILRQRDYVSGRPGAGRKPAPAAASSPVTSCPTPWPSCWCRAQRRGGGLGVAGGIQALSSWA
jgi:hypothetical protein